jgi:hypothetical protein
MIAVFFSREQKSMEVSWEMKKSKRILAQEIPSLDSASMEHTHESVGSIYSKSKGGWSKVEAHNDWQRYTTGRLMVDLQIWKSTTIGREID